MIPQEELAASRESRRRAWENLQEIRWVIKDTAGVELPSPERETIDLEGRIVKDGVRKSIRDRQLALADLVHAIKEYRKLLACKSVDVDQCKNRHRDRGYISVCVEKRGQAMIDG